MENEVWRKEMENQGKEKNKQNLKMGIGKWSINV